ncbi:hypothetical protein [Campylobacter sputorum]|uniref:hypothetical protein n=1 Tax=Campylobacter sputorum TaxID=206 RepID=UPI000B785259|nr:hypothetical protein [Campylobacter sputorum]ASM37397.1 putative membrane protein [Campylobacter sputorum bv. faecalis CCUG 20703]
MIDIAFAKLENIAPFLHILSVAIFLGTSINGWISAKFVFRRVAINEDNVELFFYAIKIFGIVIFSSMIIIFLTGIFLIGDNLLKIADPMLEAIIATKFAIFLFVLINLCYMAFRFKKSLNAKKRQDYLEVRENLVIIFRYFTPLNIVCMCFAIFLGINFRNL